MLRCDFQASFCMWEPGVGGRDVKLRWGRRRIFISGGGVSVGEFGRGVNEKI